MQRVEVIASNVRWWPPGFETGFPFNSGSSSWKPAGYVYTNNKHDDDDDDDDADDDDDDDDDDADDDDGPSKKVNS